MGYKKNIIHLAEDCSIKKFEDCQFKQKYNVLLIEGNATDEELKAAFEHIYAQYVDFAGLWETRAFELYAYISSLEGRVTTIKRFVELQKLFIQNFSIPFLPALTQLKKYGHKLYFNPGENSVQDFLAKLDRIVMMEARYEDQIIIKTKELVALHNKKEKKEHTPLETRRQWVSMLTKLQQNKYIIDREKTTVEDLGVMIKDSKDQAEEHRIQNQYKPRR